MHGVTYDRDGTHGADALDFEAHGDLAHYIRQRLPRAPKAPAPPREPLRESARRRALEELTDAAREAGLGEEVDDER
ncbi:MAG TPA: hypothetical protein VFG73_02395 [Rhodanobacteraceae bacterium]|nr:hypothetical protein [Rhodanobacteraceae bacterium]